MISAASRSPPSTRKLVRAGARDLGILPVHVGQAVPVGAQAGGILAQCRQRFRVRARAQQVALRRIVDLALDQLIDQRRDFRLAAGRRERPQLEPQRRGVQSRLALQFAQLAQRVAGLSALQRRFRGQHEARHRQAADARIRSAEVRSAPRRSRAVDRRARADQRRQCRKNAGMASASSAIWRALP